MSLPSNIPELAIPDQATADEVEVARCLDHAAELVETFARQSAPGALDALLDAVTAGPGASAERALDLAKAVTRQSETLHGEVERFLSVTKQR